MEMAAFDRIVLPHVILLVPDIIAAIAIIKAAVVVIIEVVVAVIVVYTIPGEAILVTDAADATPDGDCHLNVTTAGHNLYMDLAEDVNPTHIARVSPDHREEDSHCSCLQIVNAPGVLLDLPGGSDTESIEAVYCSHQLSKLSHEVNY